MFSWLSPLSSPVIMHLLDLWLWFQLSTYLCLVLVCFTFGRCFLLSTTRGLSRAWEFSHCWPPIRWVLLPRWSLPRCLVGIICGEADVKTRGFVLSSFTLKTHFTIKKKVSFCVHPQLMRVNISNLLPIEKRKPLFHTKTSDLRSQKFYFLLESMYFKICWLFLNC